MIHFKAPLETIGSIVIMRIPEAVSRQLPSRGMTLVDGTFNEVPFQTVLEPDGKGSHWFRVKMSLQKASNTSVGDIAVLALQASRNWPEPTVPPDLRDALEQSPTAYALWMGITPMARWDWIRWIQSTKNAGTRRGRIEAACDKLIKGERRPCCFNRNLCTVTSVSKGGVLIDPS